jgi:RluA family pseudouridine synthase
MDNLQIIWSDEAIIAVNKPAGLRTIPDGYDPGLPHLAEILKQQFGPIWIVHRLDRETSGLLIVARTAAAHRFLNTQFEKRQIEKAYHALVIGVPDWEDTVVENALRINGDRKHRTVVDNQRGKPAKTAFKVLERFSNISLMESRPFTGYTHQIRAHLYALGLYIIHDSLYSSAIQPSSSARDMSLDGYIDRLPIHRLGLHAYKMTFTHPVSNQIVNLEAPYPEDFSASVQLLRDDQRKVQ